MKHFQEFSHLHGAEYLAVKKASIHREIIGMLAECYQITPKERGARSNMQSLERLGARFSEVALRRAWRETSTGLEKEKVVLSFLGSTCSFEKVIGNWLWSYSSGKIDVGIGILPANTLRHRQRTRREKEKPILSFNEMIREMKRLGRNVPLVPFLLIAVPLQQL